MCKSKLEVGLFWDLWMASLGQAHLSLTFTVTRSSTLPLNLYLGFEPAIVSEFLQNDEIGQIFLEGIQMRKRAESFTRVVLMRTSRAKIIYQRSTLQFWYSSNRDDKGHGRI